MGKIEVNFGKKIKFYRKIRGLSQSKLAKLVGCYETTISKYELDQRKPSRKNLFKIAEVLDCEPEDLVEFYEVPKRQKKEEQWSTLKALRKNKGYTQYQLAKKVGVAQIMISEYERGLTKPKNPTVVRLAAALDVSPGVLIQSIEEEAE